MKSINLQYGPYIKPPSTEEILKYDVLELHEGAFWLNGWPNNLYTCSCDSMRDKNISRTFFYLPGPHPEHQSSEGWLFNPNDMGHNFLKIYSAIQNALNSGELETRVETLFIGGEVYRENISYLISPKKLLKWALRNNISPQEEVQNSTIHLQKETKKRYRPEAMQNFVKDNIVYQFLKLNFPGKTDTYYYEHDWMRKFGSAEETIDKQFGAIRKATSSSRIKRERGAISKINREGKVYKPKVIDKIMLTDSLGHKCYNIDLLRVATETAANIMVNTYLKSGFLTNSKLEMTQNEFLDSFMRHKIIELYTKQAHPIVLEIIREWAENIASEAFQYQMMMSIELMDI